MGALHEESYNLTLKIKDRSGNVYENRSSVFPATPEEIILIQTDKPAYKPGETVRFRVVLLDADLKPLDGHQLIVKISDAERNSIKIWENTRTTVGIFKAQLELSSEPVLGEWKIHVEVEPEQKRQSHLLYRPANGAENPEKLNPRGRGSTPSRPKLQESLTFKVDRYILPKFKVTIKTPPFLTFNDTKCPVQVQAKYTYGKSVNG